MYVSSLLHPIILHMTELGPKKWVASELGSMLSFLDLLFLSCPWAIHVRHIEKANLFRKCQESNRKRRCHNFSTRTIRIEDPVPDWVPKATPRFWSLDLQNHPPWFLEAPSHQLPLATPMTLRPALNSTHSMDAQWSL